MQDDVEDPVCTPTRHEPNSGATTTRGNDDEGQLLHRQSTLHERMFGMEDTRRSKELIKTGEKSWRGKRAAWRLSAAKVLASTSYGLFIFFCTILSVIGNDVIILVCPSSVDEPFQIIMMITLFIFTADIFCNLVADERRYALSIFFPLDIFATLTIVPAFLPMLGGPNFDSGTLVLARIGRLAKGASRAGRLVKFAKLLKTCVSFGTRSVPTESEESTIVSKAGQLLQALTLRNVVAGLLLMFFAPIVFELIESSSQRKTDLFFACRLLNAEGLLTSTMEEVLREHFGNELLRVTVGNTTLHYGREDTLRDEEKSLQIDGIAQIMLTRRKPAMVASALNIGQAVYLFIILLLGNHFFMKDAESLFIRPVSRMISSLTKLERHLVQGEDIAEAKQEEETSILVKAWSAMLESISQHHKHVVRMQKLATDIARSIAYMDLDAAEAAIKNEDTGVELNRQFGAVITNLRRFKPFLPKALLAWDDNGSLQGGTLDDHPLTEGTDSMSDLENAIVSSPTDPRDIALDMPRSYCQRFDLRYSRRQATVMTVELFAMDDLVVDQIDVSQLQALDSQFTELALHIVENCKGVVMSFGGGRLRASWNAHLCAADHQHWACTCAIQLLRVLHSLATSRKYSCPSVRVTPRISIASGPCIVALAAGTEDNKTPAIVSPILDLVAQLVELNRHLHSSILISQSTYEHVGGHFIAYPVDVVYFGPPRANNNNVRPTTVVYELMPADASQVGTYDVPLKDDYKTAFFDLVQRKFGSARERLFNYLTHHVKQTPAEELNQVADFDPSAPRAATLSGVLKQALRLLHLAQWGSQAPDELPDPYARPWAWAAFEDRAYAEASIDDEDEVIQYLKDLFRPNQPRLIPLRSARISMDRAGSVGMVDLAQFLEQSMRQASSRHKITIEEDTGPAPVLKAKASSNHLGVKAKMDASASFEHFAALSGSGKEEDTMVFRDREGRLWRRSQELLGRGGFGAVYLGISEEGLLVAVKVIDLRSLDSESTFGEAKTVNRPEELSAASQMQAGDILNEIQLLSQFQNDHIVSYLGTGVRKGDLHIVMEYVACGSLSTVLQRFGKLAPPTVARYTRDMLRGLEYLHRHEIIHRDIKPSNVLLESTGNCKLADFGTAGRIRASAGDTVCVQGTPTYMAPEAFFGRADKPSDVWSLGIAVLELLTGEWPWDHLGLDVSSDVAIMFNVATTEVTPNIPDWLPENARDFCRQCCQRDPELRPTVGGLLLHPFIV